MVYRLKHRAGVDKKFAKIAKRDPDLLEAIAKKVDQILEYPYHFKPLRKPLHCKRRAHIGKSFVLVYSVNEAGKEVWIEDFDHHDRVYL